jgi:hypothetical protein
MPPSDEEARPDLHEISVVASPSSQALGSEKSDVIDVVVDRTVVPFGDMLLSQGCWLRCPVLLCQRVL